MGLAASLREGLPTRGYPSPLHLEGNWFCHGSGVAVDRDNAAMDDPRSTHYPPERTHLNTPAELQSVYQHGTSKCWGNFRKKTHFKNTSGRLDGGPGVVAGK